MQFFLNSRLRPGVSPEQFVEHIRNERDHESWELIKQGVIQHWLWKTGEAPGIMVLVNCASAEEARSLADSAPMVKEGIVDFDIDPVDPFPAKLLNS